jgi:hypothetical protein
VRLPTDLHIDQAGTIYLAERPEDETQDSWISIRDREGNSLASWTSIRDREGNSLASWTTPRGHQIWIDSHGDIYMVTGATGVLKDAAAVKYVRLS